MHPVHDAIALRDVLRRDSPLRNPTRRDRGEPDFPGRRGIIALARRAARRARQRGMYSTDARLHRRPSRPLERRYRGVTQVILSPAIFSYTSKFRTSSAFSSMNLRRASTSSPISVVKIWSDNTRSSSDTLSNVRVSMFIVVSHNWVAFISPSPL